jgi:DNA-directed RNA polymerase specialized sigma24 family protein
MACLQMTNPQSVTQWFAALRAADGDAAQKLWTRYATRLVDLARRKLGSAPKSVADEEDIALSVFKSICHGAEAGRFDSVKDRDELWWLLLATTHRKVVDYKRRHTAIKRGSGRVQSESSLSDPTSSENGFSLDQLAGKAPGPEFIAILGEENARLQNLLRTDDLRQISTLRIEGYSVVEIADRMGFTSRTVERKLRLIRNHWLEDFANER